MSANKRKVVVAMSGGVDSSVTAGLLVEEGYDVAGVSLRLWECDRQGAQSCSDYIGARTIAGILGIPHTLLDLRSEFLRAVAKPFARSYLQGSTPNPCVACNRDFKLGALLEWAAGQGVDCVATGHYARISRNPSTGHASLFRGADQKKDQSYFLFALSQEQLARTLFPLGRLTKAEVRRSASRLGLPVADRPESQDICFGDYKSLVASVSDGSELREGEIVDRSGQVLGRHRGVHNFTVGQRKGLGISASHPLYVLHIDAANQRVMVGSKEALRCRGMVVDAVNWIEHPEKKEIAAEVQIRYRASPASCLARLNGKGKYEVLFEDGFPSVTPGQAAVFYRGEQVLGGGWIEKALSE